MTGSVKSCQWETRFVEKWEKLVKDANERASKLFEEAEDRYEECNSFLGGMHPYCFMGGAKEIYQLRKRFLDITKADGERSLAAVQDLLDKCLLDQCLEKK